MSFSLSTSSIFVCWIFYHLVKVINTFRSAIVVTYCLWFVDSDMLHGSCFVSVAYSLYLSHFLCICIMATCDEGNNSLDFHKITKVLSFRWNAVVSSGFFWARAEVLWRHHVAVWEYNRWKYIVYMLTFIL